jgi:hypothetical protein
MKRISLCAAMLSIILVIASAFNSKTNDGEYYKLGEDNYVAVGDYTGDGGCITGSGVCIYTALVPDPNLADDDDFEAVSDSERHFED